MAIAQVNDAPPSFEVASVKPSKPGDKAPPFTISPGGGFTALSDLLFLIQIFYNLKPFQVVVAPGWLGSEKYAIVAKSPDGTVVATPASRDKDMPLRIQALLKERFHLEVYREKRDMQMYILVIAKGGPKLKPADLLRDVQIALGQGLDFELRRRQDRHAGQPAHESFRSSVFDETGLTGSYKFDLKWSGASLFTAVQKKGGR